MFEFLWPAIAGQRDRVGIKEKYECLKINVLIYVNEYFYTRTNKQS
jgi:hypothetical protein